jgi:hypothetical protein
MRLDRTQSWFWHSSAEKITCPCQEFITHDSSEVQPVALSLRKWELFSAEKSEVEPNERQPTWIVVVSLTNQTPCHKNIWENSGTASRMIHLSCRWRWVVKSYPWGKSYYQNPLDRSVSGTQSSMEAVKKRNLFLLLWIKPWFLGSPAHTYHITNWNVLASVLSECVSGHLVEKKHACH